MGRLVAREAIILGPRQGRTYDMGQLRAVFKADGDETANAYCISTWWMEPGFEGVGVHSHAENDEVFFVIDGSPTLQVGQDWLTCEAGTVVIVPATVRHDFRNRSEKTAGLLNFFIPGGFEPNMPGIVTWFTKDCPKE